MILIFYNSIVNHEKNQIKITSLVKFNQTISLNIYKSHFHLNY